MIRLHLLVLIACVPTAGLHGQMVADLLYGFDRNVESSEAEYDGWLSGSVEWTLPSGLRLGVGTDHHFEGAALAPSDHRGWSIYMSLRREFPMGAGAPFLRGGIGLGRAPCEGDTCTDGLHVRGSGGIRFRFTDRVGLTTELGLSRVSRPFGGVGLAAEF